MTFVLDATVFFSEWRGEGGLLTTPAVVEELRDSRSRFRYEVFVTEGLEIKTPSQTSIDRIGAAMIATGDATVLSPTDIELLALSLEERATLVTDDFAIQNVAHALGIPTLPVQQRPATRRSWRYRCRGCGRYFRSPGTCPVCGSEMKRTIK